MKNPFKRRNNDPAASGAFRIGDSVRVKDGVLYPDVPEIDISGWQGRITDVSQLKGKPPVVGLRWDSIALRHLPEWLIAESEEDGLDWTEMYLYPSEVESSPARDTQAEADAVAAELKASHQWSFLGEEGQRINAVLAGVAGRGAQFEVWKRYLKKTLNFPFEAKVVEFQEGGQLRSGDVLKVLNIEIVDDLYGIIVDCRRRRCVLDAPLADLEVTNRQSVNYQPVKDYAVWFANLFGSTSLSKNEESSIPNGVKICSCM